MVKTECYVCGKRDPLEGDLCSDCRDEFDAQVRNAFPPPRLGAVVFMVRQRIDPDPCWDTIAMRNGERVHAFTYGTADDSFGAALRWARNNLSTDMAETLADSSTAHRTVDDMQLEDRPVTKGMTTAQVEVRLAALLWLDERLHRIAGDAGDLGLSASWLNLEGIDDDIDRAINVVRRALNDARANGATDETV